MKNVESSIEGIKKAGSGLKDIGSNISNVGKKMTAGLTVPIIGVGVAAVLASNKLNAGLGNVQSLGVSQARVEELKGSIQSLAVETGTGTGLMVDGLYQVVFSFW